MTRYLRIAAAIAFALLACALIGFWVRSYYQRDIVVSPRIGGHTVALVSSWGGVGFHLSSRDDLPYNHERLTYLISESAPPVVVPYEYGFIGAYGFEIARLRDLAKLSLPHWFPAASSLALAAAFTFKRDWRFSLRTLLIATTLIAALFGLVVYAIR